MYAFLRIPCIVLGMTCVRFLEISCMHFQECYVCIFRDAMYAFQDCHECVFRIAMYAFLGMPCMRLRMRCMTCRWTPATIPRDPVSASGEYSLFLTHRCLRYYTETHFLFLGSGIHSLTSYSTKISATRLSSIQINWPPTLL